MDILIVRIVNFKVFNFKCSLYFYNKYYIGTIEYFKSYNMHVKDLILKYSVSSLYNGIIKYQAKDFILGSRWSSGQGDGLVTLSGVWIPLLIVNLISIAYTVAACPLFFLIRSTHRPEAQVHEQNTRSKSSLGKN